MRPLPPQLPHQRPRRMAEQFLHRGGIELVEALELLAVDAAGHEQAIDPEPMGACEVGTDGIADRQYAVEPDRVAVALGGKLHGPLIDRSMRLAVEDHLAA